MNLRRAKLHILQKTKVKGNNLRVHAVSLKMYKTTNDKK